MVKKKLSRECGLARSTFSSEINTTGERVLGLRSSFLSYADQICCSTEHIQNEFHHLAIPSILRYNKLPKAFASDYDCVKKRIYGNKDRKVNILYMSGTATHGKDFEICHGPLVKLAQNHADKFNLILLGEVQLAICSMIQHLGVSVHYQGQAWLRRYAQICCATRSLPCTTRKHIFQQFQV